MTTVHDVSSRTPVLDPECEAALLLTEAAYLKVEAAWALAMAERADDQPSAACRDLSPFGR